MRGGCVRKVKRGVYSKKPISRNAKPSSDAPQTKQTKHLIRLIVRDIPQLNGCMPMRARCVVNSQEFSEKCQVSYTKDYHHCNKHSSLYSLTIIQIIINVLILSKLPC